jgi:hypothetical protein
MEMPAPVEADVLRVSRLGRHRHRGATEGRAGAGEEGRAHGAQPGQRVGGAGARPQAVGPLVVAGRVDEGPGERVEAVADPGVVGVGAVPGVAARGDVAEVDGELHVGRAVQLVHAVGELAQLGGAVRKVADDGERVRGLRRFDHFDRGAGGHRGDHHRSSGECVQRPHRDPPARSPPTLGLRRAVEKMLKVKAAGRGRRGRSAGGVERGPDDARLVAEPGRDDRGLQAEVGKELVGVLADPAAHHEQVR